MARFKHPAMEKMYRHFLSIEITERIKNRGASLYDAFMGGYNGERCRYVRGSACYAAYCAGKERRRREGDR